MQIYSENNKFYIIRKNGFFGKKVSRSWIEFFTKNGTWIENKEPQCIYSSFEEAENAAPRIVKDFDEESKLNQIVKFINEDKSGDLGFIKYTINKIINNQNE